MQVVKSVSERCGLMCRWVYTGVSNIPIYDLRIWYIYIWFSNLPIYDTYMWFTIFSITWKYYKARLVFDTVPEVC